MHRAPKLLHEDGQLALAQPELDDPGSKSRASGLKNIARHTLGETWMTRLCVDCVRAGWTESRR